VANAKLAQGLGLPTAKSVVGLSAAILLFFSCLSR